MVRHEIRCEIVLDWAQWGSKIQEITNNLLKISVFIGLVLFMIQNVCGACSTPQYIQNVTWGFLNEDVMFVIHRENCAVTVCN